MVFNFQEIKVFLSLKKTREESPCLKKHSLGLVETQFGSAVLESARTSSQLSVPSSVIAGW